MKHLKSSFRDLHRLFEQSVTVQDIAEPLISFDDDHSAERAREFMTSRGFDVVGVRRDGAVHGYIQEEDLKAGIVGDYLRELKDIDVLRDCDSLLRALEFLKSRRWVFVRFLGAPGGIITRGDLQKAPMRMWLFGLISLLEMQMLRSIRSINENDEWWSSLLNRNRLAAARKIYEGRRSRNEEIFLSDCLQISDKSDIFKKSQELLKLTAFDSKGSWHSFTRDVEKVRNNLAHANNLGAESWPRIAELAIQIERILKNLEESSSSSLIPIP